MDLSGNNNNLRPGGIDEMMNYLVKEYMAGRLGEDEESINKHVDQIRQTLKDNGDNRQFVEQTRMLFNDVKDIKPFSPSRETCYDQEEKKDCEMNIPSER